MTMPTFEPVAFVQSNPDGHLHLAEITKTEACQNLDQWDRQFGWKAVPLHTADQLTEAYEAGKRDAIPEGWAQVPKEILDRFPEINPSNYDHDDACSLNAWGVELVLAAAQKGEE